MTRHCRRCDRDRRVPDEIAYNQKTCRRCARRHRAALHARKPCAICGGRKPKGARRRLCNFCRVDPATAHRIATARYYERLRQDPARWAAFLEAKRMQYRLRAERDGRPSTPVPSAEYAKPSKWWRLPAKPLRIPVASWLEDNDASVNELAENARLDFMTVHRILAGTKDIVLVDTADRLLTAIGLHLDNVYDDVPVHGSKARVNLSPSAVAVAS